MRRSSLQAKRPLVERSYSNYDHNPVLPRLYSSYDQLVYFCLPIAEMDYFDLTPTPPVFKHFDLMVGDFGDGFVGERFKTHK
jgi:hypothetical protein